MDKRQAQHFLIQVCQGGTIEEQIEAHNLSFGQDTMSEEEFIKRTILLQTERKTRYDTEKNQKTQTGESTNSFYKDEIWKDNKPLKITS